MLSDRRVALGLLITILIAGCSAGSSFGPTVGSSQTQASGNGLVLPTVPPNSTCGGTLIGQPIILVATSDRTVVGRTASADLPILWPPGFRAVLDPSFRGVLDGAGNLFATPGEDISPYTTSGHWGAYNACATGSGVAVYPAP